MTAGRVGSAYRQLKHFFVMHIGVKKYEVRTGRDGVSRFKYVGSVADTVTLDRYIRPKKERIAKEWAQSNGAAYLRSIKHNQVVPPLVALAAEFKETA